MCEAVDSELLVSVVTPCLNPGARLECCLVSVAAQTYRRVEHVVVDGGSTDGTTERLRDAGIRFVSEPDRGQADALNKGFALASGDVLGWLNADDELTPRAVEHVVEALRAAPGAGWAYGDCEVRRDDRRELLWRPPRRVDLETLEALGDVVPQPGSFVRREALGGVLPLDESFQLAMDFDLWLRLLEAGARPVYVPHTLAVFEIHEASKTGSIGRAAFFEEEERALLAHGRGEAAAFARGRAAAAAAAADPALDLEGAVSAALAREPPLPADPVWASARVESALIVLQRSLRGIVPLFRSEPWRYRATRRRIRSGARRGLVRVLRRAVGLRT
jgi:glycosyltransferase involved in cell wall biosynthesis